MLPEDHEEHENSDEHSRLLAGSFVQFSEGAAVATVLLPSDFSAVYVSGLAANINISSVQDLVRINHGTINKDNIKILNEEHVVTKQAHITVADPEFARTFKDQLWKTEPDLRVELAEPRLPAWAAKKRVNAKKVQVMWYRPTKLVYLNFDKDRPAQRCYEKFRKGYYNVCGQTVKASPPSGRWSPRNPQGLTVLLQNVPCQAARKDIVATIAEYDRPTEVRPLDFVGDQLSDKARAAKIKDLLRAHGQVEIKDSTGMESSKVKMLGYFVNEQHAEAAVSALNGKNLVWLNEGKLYVQLYCSAKIKIPNAIFERIEASLHARRESWEDSGVIVSSRAGPIFRVVKVEAEQSHLEAVKGATNFIEKLSGGRTVEVDGAPIWSSSLMFRGSTTTELTKLQRQENVLLKVAKKEKSIIYFGPDAQFEETCQTLHQILHTAKDICHAIDLDEDQFRWLLRGGMKHIQYVLGENAVSLDPVSTPKRANVTSTSLRAEVERMIHERDMKDRVPSAQSATPDCAICWTEAEDAITTKCAHTYCSDCFSGMCLSAAEKGAKVVCQGASGTCGNILSNYELEEHLATSSLDKVFEYAFKAHVASHAAEFGYCSTPDCGQLFRRTVLAKALTCKSCLEVNCTRCGERHSAQMTCAEYKDQMSGGSEALERIKRELDIRDCPKCKTALEKTYGCNHMTCGGCRTHICWFCMKTFKVDKETYDHMHQYHGGIGLRA